MCVTRRDRELPFMSLTCVLRQPLSPPHFDACRASRASSTASFVINGGSASPAVLGAEGGASSGFVLTFVCMNYVVVLPGP